MIFYTVFSCILNWDINLGSMFTFVHVFFWNTVPGIDFTSILRGFLCMFWSMFENLWTYTHLAKPSKSMTVTVLLHDDLASRKHTMFHDVRDMFRWRFCPECWQYFASIVTSIWYLLASKHTVIRYQVSNDLLVCVFLVIWGNLKDPFGIPSVP